MAGATLSSLRAGRSSETVVKWWFLYAAGCRGRRALDSYIFVHAAVAKHAFKFWMARRCSETHILILLDEPSRRIRWVDCTKLWRNAINFELSELLRALSWACERLCFGSIVLWNLEEASPRNDHFGSFFRENCRKHRAKCSFRKLCFMKFGRCLARNDPFGSFFCENCRKHRAKRSFWKLCFLWNLSEASHETIILEAFSVKFPWSLARNNHFGSFFCEILTKPRAKRSFWNLLFLNFEEASHETIILEPSSVKIVGSFARNAPFGSFFCENLRRPRAKRSFWNLLLWNFDEASHIAFTGRWSCSLHWFWFLRLLSPGGEVFLYIHSDFSHCFDWVIFLYIDSDFSDCFHLAVKFFSTLTPMSHIAFTWWWGFLTCIAVKGWWRFSFHWCRFLTFLSTGGEVVLYIDFDFSHCFDPVVGFFCTLIPISHIAFTGQWGFSLHWFRWWDMKSSWNRHLAPAASETLPSHLGDAFCMENFNVWRNAALSTKSNAPSPPNTAPATKHDSTLLGSSRLLLFPTLYYTILFSIQYSTLLFSSLLFCTVLFFTLLFSTLLFFSILCSSFLFSTILYSSILYSSILFYSLLFFSLLYYSLLLFFTLLFPTLLFSTPFFFTLVFFLPLFSTPLFSLLYYSLSFLKLRNSEVSHPNFLW